MPQSSYQKKRKAWGAWLVSQRTSVATISLVIGFLGVLIILVTLSTWVVSHAPGVTSDAPAAEAQKAENLKLPDLRAEPVRRLYIQRDPETGRRELRFDMNVVNVGEAALELIGASSQATERTTVVQRIPTRQGEVIERPVGNFIFHIDHDHWHFEDFTEFELLAYTETGSLGEVLATTGKMTFCIYDDAPMAPRLPNAPTSAVYENCHSSGRQGISPGWADIYPPDIPGQRLDIQELPDGRYALRSTADGAGRILESDETNNASLIGVEIIGNRVRVLSGL